MSPLSRRLGGLAVAGALLLSPLIGVTAGTPAAAEEADPTFHNAVSDSFSDSFADPAVIRAQDGWWYAYSTADPLHSGERAGIMHIARTKDWRDWEYLGTVFDDTNRPSWATMRSGLWAPDVRYVNGQYVLYFTVTDTTANPGSDNAIGMATAPTPTGPWTASEEPVIAPRKAPDGSYWWTIDPALFTDVDGTHYLYFGSYFGGVWVTRLSDDATTAVGEPQRVTISNRFEGSYVIRRDGWYYLMASVMNCCAGPTTGYTVLAGRSRNPLGPFTDADGLSLLDSYVGGTTVVTQNGNRFIGTGHHSLLTDTEGRDFLVYHGIDRTKPWMTDPFGINRRPMLIDRLDWVDGWPKVRAGRGPSDTDQPSPESGSLLGGDPSDPAGVLTGAERGSDPQGGATALVNGTVRTTGDVPAPRSWTSVDIAGDDSAVVELGDQRRVVIELDREAKRLVARTEGRGRVVREETALPASAGWQRLLVVADRGRVTVSVSESGLNDPTAEVVLLGVVPDAAPLRVTGDDLAVDNLTVNRRVDTTADPAPVPEPGAVLFADDFDDPDGTDPARDGWEWVRRDPAARISSGALAWPPTSTDITGTTNDAPLLLRDVPTDRDWIAEVKLHLDLGTDLRNYQQAGMIVHRNDDDVIRLGSVAIWETRQTEYGRELVGNADGRLSYGAAPIGTPAPTMWMRIAHHRNAAGEHLYRAATSRDGEHWTWGAVWTMPADATPRLGLYSHGGASPANVARFSDFRLTATEWPADPGAGE